MTCAKRISNFEQNKARKIECLSKRGYLTFQKAWANRGPHVGELRPPWANRGRPKFELPNRGPIAGQKRGVKKVKVDYTGVSLVG
jgi:hypothetical protein